MEPSLVHRANRLLQRLQTQRKPIVSFDELRASASSLSVFLYERTIAHSNDIFDKVVRAPQYEDDFLYNAELVVEALRERFGAQVAGISGQGVFAGDAHQLDVVLGIFEQLTDAPELAEEGARDAAAAAAAAAAATAETEWWRREMEREDTAAAADEFAALEELGLRFPEYHASTRRRLQSLRALARHRDEATLKTQPGRELHAERERDKARFRSAYKRLLDDERREARLEAQRNALLDKLARERDKHERKVEQLRLQRLADDLAREAKARRARRVAREEELVRTMFESAFDIERENVLAARAEAAREQAERDKEALRKYEAAKAAAQDQLDLVTEQLAREEAQRKAERRHQKEALATLGKELKETFARRLDQVRVALESREEDRLLVNTAAIERAFTMLQENAQALVRLGA